jgi:uncharacterized membrane protein
MLARVLRDAASGSCRVAPSMRGFYPGQTMAQSSAPSATAPEPFLNRTFAGRLDGIDVARALAFGGMLLAHFARPMRPGDPGWLQALDNIADGRAAPLFCVLLGVGAGILVARGTPDRVLVQRGLALFVIGLAIWPRTDRVYLILPHYGVLLALVPLFRRLSTRALLPVAALAFVVPSVITAFVDGHGLRGSPQPATYDALLDTGSLLGQLSWTGGYPLIGWIGFVLVGLWVARQPLRDRVTQFRLFAGGAAIVLLQPVAATVFRGLDGQVEDPNARGWSTFFDGTAHSNQAAWYVLGSATAVAVIAGCLLLVHAARPVLRPFAVLGTMALSAYLAHLVIGARYVWEWRDENRPALETQMLVAAAVFALFAIGALLWSKLARRGPVESVLRAISG